MCLISLCVGTVARNCIYAAQPTSAVISAWQLYNPGAMSEQSETYVLVHGAWVGGWCWREVATASFGGHSGIDFQSPRPPGRSSWSLNGQPLPFVPIPADIPPCSSERGLSFLPIYDGGLNNAAAVARAEIPVERATGPILLVSGGDDRMWPAERMCRMVVDRLRRAGRDHLVKHLTFPEAGHVLFPVEASDRTEVAASIPVDLGGQVEAAIAAHASAWPEVLRHLRWGGAGALKGQRQRTTRLKDKR